MSVCAIQQSREGGWRDTKRGHAILATFGLFAGVGVLGGKAGRCDEGERGGEREREREKEGERERERERGCGREGGREEGREDGEQL